MFYFRVYSKKDIYYFLKESTIVSFVNEITEFLDEEENKDKNNISDVND